MKETNNSGTPAVQLTLTLRLKLKLKSVFLAALHVLAVVLVLDVSPAPDLGAARVLP